MTIAVHIVNTPKHDARELYDAGMRRMDDLNLRHPAGRQSHTAWVVGDVLHVLDLWESEEQLNAWMLTLGPILEDFGMELAAPPEMGELVQVVLPN